MTEAEFNRRIDEMVFWLMEQQPVFATQMGLHTWDDRLGDYSLESLERQHERIKSFLAEVGRIDPSGFSKDGQIDVVLVNQLLKSFVRQYEVGEDHRRNPNLYLDGVMGGVFSLIMKDFAPLPERLRNAIARTRQIPQLLSEGRTNLEPEKVPEVWAKVALEQARMAPGLFQGLLPTMAADWPEMREGLLEAGQAAAVACQEFARYLEEEVLPVAKGEFATGEGLFNELLRENHMVDYDATELLATGWRLFQETRTQMEALAREIHPNKTVPEILEQAKADHPPAEGVLPAYREAMAATRQFVVEHQIATIPEGERLSIIETPMYMRPLLPYAAYMPPGIFEKELEGLFLVTPVDPAAPLELQEQKLKGHFYAKLPVTTLHEGYPGHHLQLVWSVTRGSTARKLGMALSTLFIEGWAFYCEELMERLGYIAQPIQRLGRLADQLWRAARIIIDVSLHCRGMSMDEAVEFLVREVGLEPSNALAEVRRYTFSPTQPQSYLMGKLEILKIVEEYRRRHPDTSLRQMHDAILAAGSLPPRLLRRQLFG